MIMQTRIEISCDSKSPLSRYTPCLPINRITTKPAGVPCGVTMTVMGVDLFSLWCQTAVAAQD